MTTLISAQNSWALFAILAAIAALSIFLEQKYAWASQMTGCVIALIGAMILSNLRIIPVDAPAYDFVWGYVVPLAIPMLLLKADIRKIWKDSGRLLVIFLIGGFGTIAGAFLAYYLLAGQIKDLHIAAAMMVGTYTGGSVNLVAMADAFKADGVLVSTSVVADNLLMALYFFVLIAIPSIKFFYNHFRHPIMDEMEKQKARGESGGGAASYWTAKPVSLKDIAFAFAVAFVIVAVSTDFAKLMAALIPKGNFFLDLMNGLFGNKYLIITTLTMCLATFLPGFTGNIAGAQEIGTFLIHIFFTVIGVPASVYLIVTQAPLLLVFCGIIVAMNMVFSYVFGKMFNFTLEEITIASNANIGGPTTAAALAIAKGWEELVVPALLVGTFGYVIGNYYGLFVGTFLSR
ncbi:MAG: DUF819 family protein [Acidaminococcaceae bacterium]|nr:DUF819 family protein [Acidaminococcaceae bacterium]